MKFTTQFMLFSTSSAMISAVAFADNNPNVVIQVSMDTYCYSEEDDYFENFSVSFSVITDAQKADYLQTLNAGKSDELYAIASEFIDSDKVGEMLTSKLQFFINSLSIGEQAIIPVDNKDDKTKEDDKGVGFIKYSIFNKIQVSDFNEEEDKEKKKEEEESDKEKKEGGDGETEIEKKPEIETDPVKKEEKEDDKEVGDRVNNNKAKIGFRFSNQ